ncbi:B-cell differentiation antigen CD72 [Elgaria multicarinata webbii]|uniref:B-cell differentiation antigen CD72 n=1 Tax=Elgaria multicarinata webbii TaxID=159646 RepID=UPI002FCD447B
MSQAVTYADLRFTMAPREKSLQAQQEVTGDGELTYENIHVSSSPQEKETASASKGPSRRLWLAVALGLSLVLLVTIIGLGVLLQRVSQQLQETSQAYKADNSSLAKRIEAQEESLRQKQTQLQKAQDQLLSRAKEKRDSEEALNATWTEACNDWCPQDWVLFQGKCLLFSREKKTWKESQRACEAASSRLLIITKSWGAVQFPGALQGAGHWIGLTASWLAEQQKWTWVWVNGAHYEGEGPLDPTSDMQPVWWTTSHLHPLDPGAESGMLANPVLPPPPTKAEFPKVPEPGPPVR